MSMKNKFWFLTKVSLKRKVGSKWFVVVNVLLAIAIIALVNINSIITYFGGDFNQETEVLVKDTTNRAYDVFQANIMADNNTDTEEETGKITVQSIVDDEETIKENLQNDQVLVILNEDDNQYLSAQIISNEKIDTLTYQMLVQSLNQTKTALALEDHQIDPAVLSDISRPITVERLVLNADNNADENTNLIMSTVFPTIILPFFMLTIFLVQMVGGEICEEKTTKSMEIIISNVSPQVHLGSKILASNLFVLLQGFLLVLYVVIGLAIGGVFAGGSSLPGEIANVLTELGATGLMDKLVYLIPLALILLILSFIAYSLVAGILASMTTNMEDFQQIQTPIMLLSLAGYYLAIMAGMFEGSPLLRILSYVPFLSCLVSPSLLMMGQIGIIDVTIAIVVLIIFIAFLVKYGLKIYKVGILNYSNEKVWKRFAKAVKTKDV
mgnify:CR=1 FL=1